MSKQTILIITLGAVAVVIIVAILLVILLPGNRGEVPASGSGSASGSVSLADSYDQDDFSLPVEQYAGTVLAETPDAGDEYVTDTLFIGDSNTEAMLNFRDTTGVTMNNGIGISKMSVTAVTSLDCVKFKGMAAMTIPEAVAVMQPRRLVFTFGTNDAGSSVDSFIASYRKALEAIIDAYPYTDIIIGSVFPIAQANSYSNLSMERIDAFNVALLELAAEMDVKFLNWSDALKDPSTGYAKKLYMLSDGVHLNKAGMGAIFDYFRTHALDSADDRPKPLNTGWVREGTPAGLFPEASSSSSSSSSSGSSSSSQAGSVVTFSTNGFGTISPASITLEPGKTSGNITVKANAGYVVGSWECSAGGMTKVTDGTGGETIWTYTLPSTVTPGTAVTVKANFVASPATSASSSSQAPAPTQITVSVFIDVNVTNATVSGSGLPLDPTTVTLDPTNGGTVGGFSYTITPETGYTATWLVNGTPVGATVSSITIPAGTASGTQYQITASVTANP